MLAVAWNPFDADINQWVSSLEIVEVRSTFTVLLFLLYKSRIIQFVAIPRMEKFMPE